MVEMRLGMLSEERPQGVNVSVKNSLDSISLLSTCNYFDVASIKVIPIHIYFKYVCICLCVSVCVHPPLFITFRNCG
jgi:hypothetical protein